MVILEYSTRNYGLISTFSQQYSTSTVNISSFWMHCLNILARIEVQLPLPPPVPPLNSSYIQIVNPIMENDLKMKCEFCSNVRIKWIYMSYQKIFLNSSLTTPITDCSLTLLYCQYIGSFSSNIGIVDLKAEPIPKQNKSFVNTKLIRDQYSGPQEVYLLCKYWHKLNERDFHLCEHIF